MIKVCVTNGVMWKPAEKLLMTEEQRTTLKTWVGAKTSPQRTVLRARICLLAADGLSNRSIAQNLKTSRPTVVQWRKRFEERGSEGLAEDAPHGLSSRALPAEKINAIVDATLHTTPPNATHWSIVITSSVHDPATIIRSCYECGANYYFVKPLDFKQMKHQMQRLGLIA